MSEEKKDVDPGTEEGNKRFSDEELTRLVATGLADDRVSRYVPVWFIRVISVLAGGVALLLLFLFFR